MTKRIFIISLFIISNICAGEIKGTLTFKKKPPTVGLFYLANDNSLVFKKKPSIDQSNKQFTKKLVVAKKNKEVVFNNLDKYEHNIYANDKKNKVKFDVGLIASGEKSEIKIKWDSDKMVRVACKIHPKMKMYIANINTKHHEIIDFQRKVKTKTFTLNYSGSKNTFLLWLPGYDKIEIDLKKGEIKSVELTRKKKVKGEMIVSRD